MSRPTLSLCLSCALVAGAASAYQLRPLPDVDGRDVSILVQAKAIGYEAFGESLESALKDDLAALGFRTERPPDWSGWALATTDDETGDDAQRAEALGGRHHIHRKFDIRFFQSRGDKFEGEILDLRQGCLDIRGSPHVRSAVDKFGLDAWARCLSRAIVLDVMRRPEITRALSDRMQIARFRKGSDQTAPHASIRVATADKTAPIKEGARVAVLEFQHSVTEISTSSARYFSEKFRHEALRQLPKCEIVTTENLLVLLQASGKKLEDCEGECAVETGRRLGVDVVVSGAIQKVGTNLKLTVSIHETQTGKLLSVAIASAKSLDELDAASLAAAQQLYFPVKQ
jgi:TolB-like protein